MMVRLQISLPVDQHRRLKARCRVMDIAMAEYIRRLLAMELHRDFPPRRVEDVFDLGRSGGSDVARLRDEYAADSAVVEWARELRARPSQ